MTERLQAVLARAEKFVINDERAKRIEAENKADEKRALEDTRRARLKSERVPLKPNIRESIVTGIDLPRRGTSLIAVKRWMAKPELRPTLVLSGKTGCGKSAAAAYALANTDRALWRPARDVVRTFAGYFGDAVEDQEAITTCRLLVIDDVGRELEQEIERFSGALVDILEARKEDDRRTIFTTNMEQEAFNARYRDVRIQSRMNESATWVMDTGPDLRGLP